MNDSTVIRAEGLCKSYRIYSNPWHRALEWCSPGRKQYGRVFHALEEVSFSVRRGECLGIIGANGAGKSTLLKILSGALHPSAGSYEVHGRLLSLLELGTGFNPNLTGRQNLFQNASLLGFDTVFVKGLIPEMEAFAEEGGFFDRPVRLYSSGMYVRLAFSLFTFLKPEVLIIDEALSVGDTFFQQKCMARMKNMVSSNSACLFVSHQMNAILSLCTKAILLDQGRLVLSGAPKEVVAAYLSSMGKGLSDLPRGDETATLATGVIHRGRGCPRDADTILRSNLLSQTIQCKGIEGLLVEGIRVTDIAGRESLQTEMDGELTFHILLRAASLVREPDVGIRVFDRFGTPVFAAGSRQSGCRLPDLAPGEGIVVDLSLKMSLEPGEYTFGIGAPDLVDGRECAGNELDVIDSLGPLVVTWDSRRPMPFFGLGKLPMRVKYAVYGYDAH